jgi:hypothetical protein
MEFIINSENQNSPTPVSSHYFCPPQVESTLNRNEYQESYWDKRRPARKADNITAICEPIV